MLIRSCLVVLSDSPRQEPGCPPVRALPHGLDVQLAEEEALVVGCVAGRLGDRRAHALSHPWLRRRARPPGGGLSCRWVLGPGSPPGLRTIPRSRPVWTSGRLLWHAVRHFRDLPSCLSGEERRQSLDYKYNILNILNTH